MINSGLAQFIHKPLVDQKFASTSNESNGGKLSTGMVVIILVGDKHKATDAYLCKVTPAAIDDTILWSNIDKRADSENSDPVFIRFSVCVKIPLKSRGGFNLKSTRDADTTSIGANGASCEKIHNEDDNDGNDYVDDEFKKVCCDLENMLGLSIKTKLIYHIDHIFDTTPYTRKMSEVHMEKCCVASPIEIGEVPSRKINGYVVSVYTSEDNGTAATKFRKGITPNPLSSLTISPTSNTKSDWRFELANKSTTQLSFLQLCLKRQLVGCVIIDPKGFKRGPYSTFQSTRIEKDLNIDNDGRCIVSMCIPDPTGVGDRPTKHYHFHITNTTPYKNPNDLHGEYQTTQTSLFLVLPSTRITLLANNDNPMYHSSSHMMKDEGDMHRIGGEFKSNNLINNQPDASEILLKTIQATRSCSRIMGLSTDKTESTIKASSGVDIPRAFLLSGPPGVGKTYAVQTAVQNSNMDTSVCMKCTRLKSIRGSELLSSGSTEADAATALKEIFDLGAAFTSKKEENVFVIFMDECDALLSSKTVASALAKLLDQLSCNLGGNMFGLSSTFSDARHALKQIIVVAGTNRIDAIPVALRRPGRFDREICIGPPNSQARFVILKSLIEQFEGPESRLPYKVGRDTLPKIVDNNIDSKHGRNNYGSILLDDQGLSSIADSCVGYVPADLAALVRKASYRGIENGNSVITVELLQQAMTAVGASALRESAISAPPPTQWDDIAGDVGGAKTALRRAIEWPQTKSKQFARLGLVPPRGILLHGPPGCGKTKLARAAAGAAKIAFLSLSPADVYSSSYVGEAEAVVRRAFSLARSAAPCVLFFDEIDSIVGSSSDGVHGMGRGGDRGTTAEARVLSTFLNEMDGVDGSTSDGVLLLGATNRPSTIDAALLRPGRFDRVIYVPPPDKDGRRAIIESQCKNWNEQILEPSHKNGVDVEYLSSDAVSGLMTGAEIVGACRDAAMFAVKEVLSQYPSAGNSEVVPRVLHCHLEQAFKAVKPLLSNTQILIEYTSFESGNSN